MLFIPSNHLSEFLSNCGEYSRLDLGKKKVYKKCTKVEYNFKFNVCREKIYYFPLKIIFFNCPIKNKIFLKIETISSLVFHIFYFIFSLLIHKQCYIKLLTEKYVSFIIKLGLDMSIILLNFEMKFKILGLDMSI